MEQTPEEGFEFIGYFSPSDAAKLFSAFERAGIDYRADFFDGVDSITPTLAYRGGSFGQNAQILIQAAHNRLEEVARIHTELFGDSLPNYDSTFFAQDDTRASDSHDDPSKT